MFRLPIRVQEDAANKPTAAQAYQLSGAATTGYQTFASQLDDGDTLCILAEEIDADGNPAGAWETCIVEYDDLSTDELKSRTLVASSSGSLIDWSTSTGIDATPRLTAIFPPEWDLGGWERVSRTAFTSSTASVVFSGLSVDHYYRVKGMLNEVQSGSGSYNLVAQFGYGGTPTWMTGASDYTGGYVHSSAGYGIAGVNISGGSVMTVMYPWDAVTNGGRIDIILPDIGLTTKVRMLSSASRTGTYGGRTWSTASLNATAGAAIDAFRVLWGGGYNMINGEFELWRRRKAYGMPEGW